MKDWWTTDSQTYPGLRWISLLLQGTWIQVTSSKHRHYHTWLYLMKDFKQTYPVLDLGGNGKTSTKSHRPNTDIILLDCIEFLSFSLGFVWAYLIASNMVTELYHWYDYSSIRDKWSSKHYYHCSSDHYHGLYNQDGQVVSSHHDKTSCSAHKAFRQVVSKVDEILQSPWLAPI